MGAIVPAVLPASREDLTRSLARYAGLVDFVQVDIIDGAFAGPASWPYADGPNELDAITEAGATLPYLGEFKFDLDLMVSEPDKVFRSWVALGASRLTVHVESTTYLPRLVQDFNTTYGHERGFAPDLIALGFAIGLETDVAFIEPFVNDIDYVQFMGIASIGKQGNPFDPRVLDRIRAFKKKHPDIPIQIDGGVTLETAPALLDAGANRLIVGHALKDAPDPKAAIAAFAALTEQYGLYS